MPKYVNFLGGIKRLENFSLQIYDAKEASQRGSHFPLSS